MYVVSIRMPYMYTDKCPAWLTRLYISKDRDYATYYSYVLITCTVIS